MNAFSEELVQTLVREVVARLRHEQADDAIPVELSARHVHLSEADYFQLFTEPPKPLRELSQPGQFLYDKRLRLIGPKGVIDNVALLGPFRKHSQVEISITDSRMLGIAVPVRHSGDIDGTPGIVLASSQGIVGLERGLIVAGRHIHMSPQDAARFGVKDKDLVCVQTISDRPVIFREVLIRVNGAHRLTMHLDLDEGNACGCTAQTHCRIIRDAREVSCGCG